MAQSVEKFLLASSSLYRRQLLGKLLNRFIAASPNIDETRIPDELPDQLAVRLAEKKARALAHRYSEYCIIASDQVAVCDTTYLGKPGNARKAAHQLEFVSGKTVKFYTSVSVLSPRHSSIITELDVCEVVFKTLSETQIKSYIEIDQPFDCACSCKVEGLGIILIERFIGDDPNALVGLPLIKLVNMLERIDIDLCKEQQITES